MALDIKEKYLTFLRDDEEMTMPVAAISSLVSLLGEVQPSTSAELIEVLQDASKELKEGFANSISLSAGCDLFLRFVHRNIGDYKDWDACRRNLVVHGQLFAERAREARSKIARIGKPLVRDHDVILVHGRSRVVNSLLKYAAKDGFTRFKVYVTEARVCNEGKFTADILREAGIPVQLIPDCAVSYVIDKCNKVFVGAEGVAESGGVINQIGSCQVAMLAQSVNKPVYCIAESHKFVRLFPLNSSDLPGKGFVSDDPATWPTVDFTPHNYITALVTDLGVLTPSAVSEELIKIWFD